MQPNADKLVYKAMTGRIKYCKP